MPRGNGLHYTILIHAFRHKRAAARYRKMAEDSTQIANKSKEFWNAAFEEAKAAINSKPLQSRAARQRRILFLSIRLNPYKEAPESTSKRGRSVTKETLNQRFAVIVSLQKTVTASGIQIAHA